MGDGSPADGMSSLMGDGSPADGISSLVGDGSPADGTSSLEYYAFELIPSSLNTSFSFCLFCYAVSEFSL